MKDEPALRTTAPVIASYNEPNWEEDSKGNTVEQSMEVGIGEPHIVATHRRCVTGRATQSPEVIV